MDDLIFRWRLQKYPEVEIRFCDEEQRIYLNTQKIITVEIMGDILESSLTEYIDRYHLERISIMYTDKNNCHNNHAAWASNRNTMPCSLTRYAYHIGRNLYE